MIGIIPPVQTYGKYKLKEPWQANEEQNYRCIAVRTAQDIVKSGHRIFETIYKPMGLTEQDAEADIKAKVSYIGLMADDGKRIYVPSSYILQYPSTDSRTFDYTTIVVDLGPQPSEVDMVKVTEEFKKLASKFTGDEPQMVEVHVAVTQSTTTVNSDQYAEALERFRLKIDGIKTSEEEIEELKTALAAASDKIKLLSDQQLAMLNRYNLAVASGSSVASELETAKRIIEARDAEVRELKRKEELLRKVIKDNNLSIPLSVGE